MEEKEQTTVSSPDSYNGSSADTAGVTTPEQSSEDLKKVVQMEVLDI